MMTSDRNSSVWIQTAQRIQAIAQTGLTYAVSPYDVERYSDLSAIAVSMLAGPEAEKIDLATLLFASERGYATPNVDVRAAVFQKIACCWFASGKTGAGPFQADGLRSDKALRSLWSARCERSPATSSKR